MTKEIEEYFFEKYKNVGFRLVPGHWPDFKSREEVDEWIKSTEAITRAFARWGNESGNA